MHSIGKFSGCQFGTDRQAKIFAAIRDFFAPWGTHFESSNIIGMPAVKHGGQVFCRPAVYLLG